MRELETEKQNRGVNWPRRGCCANCSGTGQSREFVFSKTVQDVGSHVFKIG